MGKRRKISAGKAPDPIRSQYGLEERFDDSEDEFFAGRDKVLLDERPAAKRKRRIEEQEKDLQLSDEEVLAQAQSDVDSEEDAEEQDHEQNWGLSRSDYYDADVIETEADALDEEHEARRLQQKQLNAMKETDFGFDETQWLQPAQKATAGLVIEKLPDIRVADGASKEEMEDVLYGRYPEFSSLAEDFVSLQQTWSRLQEQTASELGSVQLKALRSYLGAIAMYFAVISSRIGTNMDETVVTAFPPSELRQHAIISNLMASRQLWETVKEMKDRNRIQPSQIKTIAAKTPKVIEVSKGDTTSDEEEVLSNTSEFEDIDMPPMTKQMAVAQKKPAKRAISLQTLLANTIASEHEGSDFGDEEPLTERQAAEKAKKKKSLQFHVSQIAQKANKRGAASREAGGDDDVPRKERLRDKQERLMREAEKRGKSQTTATEELGTDSEDGEDMKANGYYESLVANSKRKKADKQAKTEAFQEAARQGAQVYEQEQIGADGKRKITYAIEKNKGLAPKRKKDVRNPRVKKRKKFDEKMKKLSSVRQVYKGGEGRGGYGGELTGIKTNVVKSIKL